MDNYTTPEVCEIVGVSYRMLDYWCRQGHVTIDGDARGSGSRRRFTPDEVAALVRCKQRCDEANAVLDSFQSGAMWKQETNGRRVSA